MYGNHKTRLKYIDRLNEELEKLNALDVSKEYGRVIKKINIAVSKIVEKKGVITKSELNELIKKHPIDINVYNRSIVSSYLESNVAMFVNNPDLPLKEKKDLLLFKPVMVASPIETAKRIYLVAGITTLTKKPKTIKAGYVRLIDTIGRQKTKLVKNIAKQYKDNLKKISKKMTDELSKDIYRDVRKFKTVKGVPLTNKELAKKIKAKYSTKVQQYRIDRSVNTTLHTQGQLAHTINAFAKGYKFKMWVNQRDGRVRHAHKDPRLVNKKIPINQKFFVPSNVSSSGKSRKDSGWAMYAGDTSLKPSQVIHCRCITVFYYN